MQRSFARFLLYVSLFPQLIAGPIVRYSDVEKEIEERKSTPKGCFYGMTRFCIGLAKKVLIADYAGAVADQLLGGSFTASTTLGLWFGVLMYMFQIYFDFSGYSDMAIGMGRIFGFQYPENFRYPVCVQDHHGVLAALAHLAEQLLPRLCLHTPRRQPPVSSTGIWPSSGC